MRIKILLPLILLTLMLAACGKSGEDEIEKTMSEKVRDFDFVNQANEQVTNEDLKGKWWIADFVFTNCETVCLPMTSNMSALQDMAKEDDLDIEFISFSIDPDFDTPEVLAEYGDNFEVDYDNWSFLTGGDFDEVRELSIKSFKSMVEMPKDETDDQIIHGTSFFLVNPEGKVIKNYPGIKIGDMDNILEDIKEIQ